MVCMTGGVMVRLYFLCDGEKVICDAVLAEAATARVQTKGK